MLLSALLSVLPQVYCSCCSWWCGASRNAVHQDRVLRHGWAAWLPAGRLPRIGT
jgi:hypothetical protein